ncbi:hypothetical protein EVAR_97969_1 [Eumeta japonica]|uniref:Uncharacterized protein n=1 Tax=Eumeta variegata TaxID=151549 RepID=A0A4C1XFK9_EUMVA|nr:hypothetical protein EVAR_97969_1 [Eumeta japonica]
MARDTALVQRPARDSIAPRPRPRRARAAGHVRPRPPRSALLGLLLRVATFTVAGQTQSGRYHATNKGLGIIQKVSLIMLRLGVTYEKSVTLGNVTMSHRTRERPAECLASLSHSTMIGLPRAQH